MKLEARARGNDTCPLCQSALDETAEPCGGCETSYHPACLEELGGCSTIGCPEFQASRASVVETAVDPGELGQPVGAEPPSFEPLPPMDRPRGLTLGRAVGVFVVALGTAALLAAAITDASLNGDLDMFMKIFLGLTIGLTLTGWVVMAILLSSV